MTVAAALARFTSLPLRMRIVLAAALAAVVICGVAGSFATRDLRVALYPYALIPEQVDEVDRRLSEWGVPHVAAGDNVRVERKGRDALRARLADLGIPHRHLASTAEALASVGALTPQSVLESQQLEGLDADVALGLRSFAGVEDARVTIAPAKSGQYADEKSTETTAAVTLRLAPHARVNGATLRKYIAASVPGLDPSRVAVVDDRGIEIKDDGGPSSDDVRAQLQTQLDRIFGEGQSTVAVTLVRDDRKREIRDVRRAPLGDRPIATTRSDERFGSDRKHYTKSNATEDRGSDVREERIESGPGSTQRLSVSVTLDQAHAHDVPAVRQIVEATVGFDRSRGDTVSVVALPLAARRTVADRSGAIPGWLAPILAVAPSLFTGVAIVVGLLVVAKPAFGVVARSIDRSSLRGVSQSVVGVAPVHVRGALAGEPPHTAAAVISALPTATAAAVLELYPPDERAAIVRRLSRPASPLLPTYEELLRVNHRA